MRARTRIRPEPVQRSAPAWPSADRPVGARPPLPGGRAAEYPRQDVQRRQLERCFGADRIASTSTGLRPLLQRQIFHDPNALGAEVYESGYEDGEQQTLDEFVAAVITADPSLATSGAAIRTHMEKYSGAEVPDFAYNTAAEAIGWLKSQPGVVQDIDAPDQLDDEISDDEPLEETGQKVGKITFPGNSYHQTVKPAIIRTIGAKQLSALVYGDKTHHNFNFWFEQDGSIYAEVNSDRNSKGKYTGYRWDGQQAVKDKQ